MRSSVIVLASIVGLAVAQSQSPSPSDCTDFTSLMECADDLGNQAVSCQTVLSIKKCLNDFCPEVAAGDELNTMINTCENGGILPGSDSGSGSGTDSETATRSGSESTSTSESTGESTSGSGSTPTSSADDSESTEFNSGIPGGGSSSTPTTSGADSTGTGIGSGGNSTISDPTNTSENGDGPVSTNSPDGEGAADRIFAPVSAIIGSLVAVMALL